MSNKVKDIAMLSNFCTWKVCLYDVDWERKCFVFHFNLTTVTKAKNCCYSTIIGNTALPQSKVTSWNIKILKSRKDKGSGGIYIGVAPFDVNQGDNTNFYKCGWYFDCGSSTLRSGPPHNYRGKGYRPKKYHREYFRTGDTVGVVMDTTKGELSFVMNGVNLGVAFDGVPLDKPLVPCVLLGLRGDSVELDTSEVKETKVNSSILVPSNVTTKSITWDSITLSWDTVEGSGTFALCSWCPARRSTGPFSLLPCSASSLQRSW